MLRRIYLPLAAVVLSFQYATAQQCPVIINEVAVTPSASTSANSMYEGVSPSDDAEWVELYNPSACNAIDISCYVIGSDMSDQSNSQIKYNWGAFTFPQGTIIPPLGYVVVGGNSAPNTNFNLTTYNNTQYFCHSPRWWLLDSYGWLALYDPSGNVVDAVYWNTSGNPGLLTTQQSYNNDLIDSCACSGIQTFIMAKNIPGIEFVGQVFSFSGLSASRTIDAASTWQMLTMTPGACNGGPSQCRTPHTANIAYNATCGGNSAAAQAIYTNNSTGPFTYLWAPGGQTAAIINNLVSGDYTVTITDACGCAQTNTITITPSSAMLVTPSPNLAICLGQSASVSITASGGTSPYTYSWSNGNTASSQTVNPAATTAYTATVTDATGCVSPTQTITITVSPPLNINIGNPTTLCNSPSVTLTATVSGGTGAYMYAWITGQTTSVIFSTLTSTSTFTVTVTDAIGCTQTQTLTVTPPNALTLNTSSTQTQCSANTGTATAAAAGGSAPYIYSWSNGQTTSSATALGSGSYTVTVTDAGNCVITQSVTITQITGMTLTITSLPSACGMNTGTATAAPAAGSPPYTYLWNTNPLQSTSIATGLAGGITYTVIVTDSNGCTQSQSVTVSGGTPPVSDFSFTPGTVYLSAPLTSFTDLSYGNYSLWSWNFGDTASGATNFSSVQNPSHAFSDTGTFCITLTVSDTTGSCSDTITKCLRVEDSFTFYIPNAFTPNGDLWNELFSGKGTSIKTFHIMIFDRWGNKIFESNDINKGWNGAVNNTGEIVQQDVYVWKVRLTDMSDKEHKYIGRVTVVK